LRRNPARLLFKPPLLIAIAGTILSLLLLAGRIDFGPWIESTLARGYAHVDPGLAAIEEENKDDPARVLAGDEEVKAEEKTVTIGVYKGPGSWDTGVEAVDHFLDYYGAQRAAVGAVDIDRNRLSGVYDAIWFPGGWADQYRNGIAVDSNIIDYVSGGGIFIGSCAGAYYFSELLQQQGQNVFAVEAFESLVELVDWGTMTSLEPAGDNGLGLAPSTEMLYAGGPSFQFPDPGTVTVIACYSVTGEPAIVYFSLGEGKVLLIGPHPELGFREAEGAWNLAGGDGAQWEWLEALLHHILG
jgi:hypothetical protein